MNQDDRARERPFDDIRQLLRDRNLLLQRAHRMAIDQAVPGGTRLSAIARWTEAWVRLKRLL